MDAPTPSRAGYYTGPLRPHIFRRTNKFLNNLNTDKLGFLSDLSVTDYYLVPSNDVNIKYTLYLPEAKYIQFVWDGVPHPLNEVVVWFQEKVSGWLNPCHKILSMKLPTDELGLISRPPLYPSDYANLVCDIESFPQLEQLAARTCIHLSYIKVWCRMACNLLVRVPIHNSHHVIRAIGTFYEPPYLLHYNKDRMVTRTICDKHGSPILYDAKDIFNEVRLEVLVLLTKRPDLIQLVSNDWWKCAFPAELSSIPRQVPTTKTCSAIIEYDQEMPDATSSNNSEEVDELDPMDLSSPEIPLASLLPAKFNHKVTPPSTPSDATKSMEISDEVSDSDSTKACYNYSANNSLPSSSADEFLQSHRNIAGSDPVDPSNALGLSNMANKQSHPMSLRKCSRKRHHYHRSQCLAKTDPRAEE